MEGREGQMRAVGWPHVAVLTRLCASYGIRMKRQARKRQSTVHAYSFLFIKKKVQGDSSYKCTPNTKMFKRNIMLPGHSEIGLAVTTLYLLQLCTMLGSSASKLSGKTAYVCSDSNGAQFKSLAMQIATFNTVLNTGDVA